VKERHNCKQEKSQVIFFLLRIQKVNEKNKNQKTTSTSSYRGKCEKLRRRELLITMTQLVALFIEDRKRHISCIITHANAVDHSSVLNIIFSIQHHKFSVSFPIFITC
jgi:hypothetical protein